MKFNFSLFPKNAAFIFSLVTLFLIAGHAGFAQLTPNDGDYRSAASGSWSATSSWEVRSGGTWSTPSTPPTSTNNVFIQSKHNITVDVAVASCKDFNIKPDSGKVTINGNFLDVYGKMRWFQNTVGTINGAADGAFYSSNVDIATGGNSNAPTTGSGALRIRGTKRTVFNTGQWGPTGFASTNLVFNMASITDTATVLTAMKMNNVTISSGTLVNADGNVRFSLNTDLGNFTIESNAKLIAARGGAIGNVIMTGNSNNTTKMGTLTVSGTLELTAASSFIDCSSFVNTGGTIIYNSGSAQSLLAKGAVASSVDFTTFGTVVLKSTSSTLANRYKTLTSNITVNDSLVVMGYDSLMLGSGPFSLSYGANASLKYYRSSASMVGAEWPATNGPKNVTVSTNSLKFSDNGGFVRTLSGALTLNGANFTPNAATDTLKLVNGSSLVKLTNNNFNTNSGFYKFGASNTDTINVIIGASGGTGIPISYSSGEMVSSASGIINFTVHNGYTYGPMTSNRSVNNLILNGTFDVGTNTLTVINNITGTGTQTATTGKISMAGNTTASNISGATFANLELNDADGFSLTGSPTVGGRLSLTTGKLVTSSNVMTVTARGSVARSAGWVNGNLKKYIPAAATRDTFAIGDSTNYTPVYLTYSGTISDSTGSITAKTTNTEHPQNSSSGILPTKSVNRYWTLTNDNTINGLTSYSPVFNFVSGDKDAGADTSRFIVKRYASSAWNTTTIGTKLSLSTSASGLTSFGDFAIGEPTVPTISTSASLLAFTTNTGTASLIQSFTASAVYMNDSILVSAPTGFEVSKDSVNFSSSINIGNTGTVNTTKVYVRIASSAAVGSYNGLNISLSSSGATTQNVSIPNSSVTAQAVATVTVSVTSLSAFPNTSVGASSAPKNFAVSGVNLGSNNITITAPTNFQVSLTSTSADFASSVTLIPSSGTVNNTTIYVRYNPTGLGANSGNVAISQADVTTQNVSVSGGIATYYYQSGSPATASNWNSLPNGTGTAAPNFNGDSITYRILKNATSDAALNISGSGTKIVLGSADSAAVTLTIQSAGAINDTIDVEAALSGSNSVIVQSATAPTFGTLHRTSEVHYRANTTISNPPINALGYGKFYVDGGSSVTVNLGVTGNTPIQTSLTVDSVSKFSTSASSTNFITIASGGSATINGTMYVSKAKGLIVSGTNGTLGGAIGFAGTDNLTLGSASTIEYNKGTNVSTYNISPITYANLTVSGLDNNKAFTAATTVNGTFTSNITGTSTLTGCTNLTMGNGSTIVITSGSLDAAPTFGSSVNVTYNGTGATTVGNEMPTSASVLNNLIVNNAAGVTISRALQVNGTLTLTSGAFAISGSNTLTMAGAAISVGSGTLGTTSSTNLTFTGTNAGPLNIPSSVTALNNLTINNTNGTPATVNAGAGITISGTLALTSGTLAMGANGLTLNGPAISGAGNLTTTGALTFGGTDAGPLKIPSSVTTLSSLTLNNTNATPATLNINSNITCSGNLALTSGTIADGGYTLTVGGNISGTGTHSGAGKIKMTGSAKTISGVTFANLEIAPGVGNTITAAANLSVNDLTLTSGTLADGGFTITVRGNLAGTGAHTGIGKISMTGASKTISGVTLANLEIAPGAGNTITAASGFTVNTSLALTSGTLADGGYTITLAGNITGTGTHSGAGKISMTGTTKTVSAVTLGNLENISSASISTIAATVTGTFTVTGTVIVGASNTLTVNNRLLLNGNSSSSITLGGGTLAYGANTTLEYNKSQTAIVADEWPAVNGPKNITISSSTASFTTAGGFVRTVSGALTLNGGSFSTNTAVGSPPIPDTLKLTNGASLVKLSNNNFNTGNGIYKFGLAATDTISVVIGALGGSGITIGYSSGELPTSTPTGVVNFTIHSGYTYSTMTGSRTVHNLNLYGNYDITTGNTLTVLNNISGSGTQTSAAAGKISMAGNTTSSNISGATFANLELNDADGFTLTGSPTITKNLTLTSGKLATSTNVINVSARASVSRPSNGGWVNGNLKKFIPAAATRDTFAIGDATNYTPIYLTYNGTISDSTGSITAKTTSTDHPQLSSSYLRTAKSVNRYWTLTNDNTINGLTSYSPVFNFVSGDKDAGVDTSRFIIKRYASSTWTAPTIGARLNLSTAASGLTAFGDFAIAEPMVPTISTSGSLLAFTAVVNNTSLIQSFSVSATEMNDSILVTAPQGFEVSTDSISFFPTVNIGNIGTVNSTKIYVRMPSTDTIGTYQNLSIALSSTGATTQNVSIPTSTVTAVPVPNVSVSVTSLSAFGYTNVGASSSSKSFVVSGVNLGSNNIKVNAPTNFKVSLSSAADFGDSLELAPIDGTVANTTIYVRYTPTGSGLNAASITISQADVSNQTIDVSGKIGAYYFQSGSPATLTNWTASSDGTGDNPLNFTSDSIQYKIQKSATSNTAWSVTGAGSKIILGDPSGAADTLTIQSAGTITGTIDVTAASSGSNSLVIQSTTMPTFGTINANAEVHLQSIFTMANAPTFGKLFIDGSSSYVTLGSGAQPKVATSLTVASGCTLYGQGTASVFMLLQSGATATINGTLRSNKSAGFVTFSESVNGNATTGGTLQFTRTDTTGLLTLGSNSTIEFYRDNSNTIQTITARTDYKNVTISGVSNNKTFNGPSTISGTLNVISSTGPSLLTFADSITVQTEIILGDSIVNAGRLKLGNGATITKSTGNFDAAPKFGTTVNVNYTGSTAAICSNEMPTDTTKLRNLTINNSGGIQLNGNTKVNGKLTLTVGQLLVSTNTLTLADSAISQGTGTLGTTNQSNLVFTGTNAGPLNIPSSVTTLNNLTINNTNGTPATVNAGAGITISGTLALTSGTLAMGANSLTLNGPAISGTGNLTTTGALSFGGTNAGPLKIPSSVSTLSSLTLNNTNATPATLNVNSNITCSGNLALTSGALADGGYTLTVGGDVSGTGTHSGSGKIKMTGSSKNISGVRIQNFELATGATISTSAASFAGDINMNGGAFTAGTGNTTTFLNGTNIYRNSTSNFNSSGGTYKFGTASSDRVNIIIRANCSTSAEWPSSPTPGKIGSLTIDSGYTYTIGNASNREDSLFTLNGNIVDNGTTITIKGHITGNGTHTGSGKILLSGNTVRTNVSGVTFGNVEFNDGDAFILTGSPRVTKTLTLTTGNITTGNYVLKADSAVVKTNAWVVGNLQKPILAAGNVDFEVGKSANYLPVSINVTNLTTRGNLIVNADTAISTSAYASLDLNKSSAITRYWAVTKPDSLVANYAGTYTFISPNDTIGYPTLSALKTAINTTGTTWVYPGTVTASTTSTITADTASSFGIVAFASPIDITVTASDTSKEENVLIDPALTYMYTGTLGSGASFTGSIVRDTGSAPGVYAIRVGTLAISPNPDNYNFNFVNGNFTILGIANPITNFASTHKSNNIVRLTWNSPIGDYDSIFIFARPDSVTHIPSGEGSAYSGANNNLSAAGIYDTDNYLVYAGTGNDVEITGLSDLTNYNFVAYTNVGSYYSPKSSIKVTTGVQPTTALAASYASSQSVLTWSNPSYYNTQSNYWDSVIVIAKSGSAVDQTPTGDGTSYTANAAFGSGTNLGSGNYVVYKGTGTTVTVTGLTNGTTQYFKTFVRHGSSWSVAQTANVTPNPYAYGDFGSLASGMWTTTNANWRKWDGNAWSITPAGAPTSTDNVFILPGHTVRVDNATRNCKNLTVENGALLKSDSLVNKPTFIKIYGSAVNVNSGGALGTTATGNSADAISLDLYTSNLTITGSGTVNFSRIRLSDSAATSTLIIDNDVTVHYHAALNGGSAGGIYTNSPMAVSYATTHVLTINVGKTLTFDQYSCYTPTANSNTNSVSNKIFNINGNMTFLDGTISGNTATPNSSYAGNQNGYFNLGASTGYTSTINIGSQGKLFVSELYPNGTKSGDSVGVGTLATINIAAGGELKVSKIADFRSASQTVTGAGTFTIPADGILRIGSADGISASGATGNIRTTTRNFSSSAHYKYEGSVAQTTGSGLPSTVSQLTLNNTLGLTLTNNVTIADSLFLKGGNVTTSSNTLTLNGGIVRTSGWIAGNLKKPIAVAATSKTFEIGGTTYYRPVTLDFNNVTVAGNITASVSQTDGAHPNISTSNISRTKRLNRYWTITNDAVALTSYDATFTFVASDILNSASTSNFIVGKYAGSTWNYPTMSTKTATTTKTTGLSSYGDFQIGENCANSFTETIAACDSLRWHGTLYTASTNTPTWTGTNVAGCDSVVTLNLTISTTPTAGITNNSGVTLLTCSQTSISLTATGGTTYSWSNSLGSTANATVTSPGTYTVTVTGTGGCTSTASITITRDITSPTAGITNNSGTTVVTCTTPTISVTATGTGTYSWSGGLGSSANASIIAAGTYTVTVTGTNGCTSTASITTTLNKTAPTAGITNNTASTVLNCTRTSIIVTATGGTSYLWDNSLGSAAGAIITAPGTYTVTVTGSNGCTSTASITVTQDITAPTAGITNNTSSTLLTCSRTAISVTATGGTSYVWSNSLGSVAAASITSPGTYSVTVTGANGCTSTASITMTQDIAAPNAGITNNSGTTVVTCTTPTISVTATGGGTYAWSGSLGSAAAASITAAGTYTVTVTGTNGCTSTASITTTLNKTAPTAGITNNTASTVLNCTRTSISVTATGGTSYVWSGTLGSSANASITTPATYTVTVTGANGCTSTASITVTQDIVAPTAGITNNTNSTVLTCVRTAISVTATGGVSYAWDNSLGTSDAASISAPGTYTVTVTGANGCTSTSSITMTQDITAPTAGITNNTGSTLLSCSRTAISVTATGGTSYVWDNSLGSAASASIIAPGTFTVTVTGANGCTSTASITVTQDIATSTGDTTVFACNSFTWHGSSYTSSANPTYTYANVNGCDSLVTLHLTVGHTNTGDTTAFACNSFNWYGTTYTSSATPTYTFTNDSGCDSVVTLHLTVGHANTGDTTAFACNSFNWYGTTYTSSATPTYTFTNDSGCDSVVTLHLTVGHTNTGDTTASACDSFTWYGTTYNTSANPTHTFANSLGCDSVVTLHLTINQSVTSTETISSPIPVMWHGNLYSTSNNTATWLGTTVNGCDSTVTLDLTITCATTYGDTTAVVCNSFTWHDVTYTVSATPTYTYINAGGCDSIVTLNLTINNATSSDTTASACGSFTWKGSTYQNSGNYFAFYTNENGCDSLVTLHLTINSIPSTPGAISGPIEVCSMIGVSTPTIYSIADVPGASSYIWTVPTGATIVSGQGTTSIGVTFDNTLAQTNQRIKVSSLSGNSCTNGLTSSITIYKTIPLTPTISGPSNVCEYIGLSTNAIYTCDSTSYAAYYTWTVPTGATLISGQGSRTIEVSFSSTFNTGSIQVAAVANCGSRTPRVFSLSRPTPGMPVSISGPTSACSYIGTGLQATYTIAPVANATSYLWTVPAGVSIVGGQNTTSLVVTFSSTFTTNLIKVKAVNNCSASSDRTLSVAAVIPTAPSSLTGPTNGCYYVNSNIIATYICRKSANATSYTWTLPAGVLLSSHPAGTGANDTVVNVTFNSNFVYGSQILVRAVGCGTSAAKSITITGTAASTPASITGPTNACEYMVSSTIPNGNIATYIIRKVSGVSSYNWTAPANATIVGHPAGLGINDTSVQIKYSAAFTGGAITVSASNACGTSTLRSFNVSRLSVGSVGTIDVTTGSSTCATRSFIYSLGSVPTQSTSLLWTVPLGGTILPATANIGGQGTMAIEVRYIASSVSGNVSVQALNNCSVSGIRYSAIKYSPCTPFASGNNPIAKIGGSSNSPMEVKLYPNPSTSNFNLQVITADDEAIKVSISDASGRLVKNINVKPFESVNFGTELKSGVYLVTVRKGTEVKTTRLLKY